MAYKTYSEVYYALSIDNPKIFKIGETTNARRREHQLFVSERFHIVYSRNIGGNKATRLFVESYLRIKIQKLPFVRTEKLDYFVCEQETDIKTLKELFKIYLEEALQII
jgi:hypothetical protein